MISTVPAQCAIVTTRIYSSATGAIEATFILDRFDNLLLMQEVADRYPGFNLLSAHWQ